MPMLKRFAQVDVFSSDPSRGNPAPIVFDAEDLNVEQKAHFASYMSREVGYIRKPRGVSDADFGLEVFLGGGEVGFVATVTLAACHAWLTAKGVDNSPVEVRIEQQGALLVVRRTAHGLGVVCPPPDRADSPDEETIVELAAMLKISRESILDAQYQNAVPARIAVQLPDAAAVLALQPEAVGVDICAWGFYPQPASALLEAKIFYPPAGVDPICGNSSGWLARALFDKGVLTGPAVITQGCTLGRNGVVRVSASTEGGILVEGQTCTTILGEVWL